MGDRTYRFFLKRENGRYDLDTSIALPSVTTIIGATLAKPQLVPYMYQTTLDVLSGGVSALAERLGDTAKKQLLDNLLETFSDYEVLDQWVRDSGIHPDEILDAASKRGHEAHSLLETLTQLYQQASPKAAVNHAEKTLKSTDPYKAAVALAWIELEPRPVFAEKVVYSLEHRYAGRLDLLADFGDERALVDLKTRRSGLGIYDSDQVQAGGYKIALEEMGLVDGHSLTKRILLAHDDGTYSFEPCWIDDSAFLDLVSLYYKKRRTPVR